MRLKPNKSFQPTAFGRGKTRTLGVLMAVQWDRGRVLTIVILGVLVAVEVANAVVLNSDLDDKLLAAVIWVSPLLVVALAVRSGGTRMLALICAWTAIAVGAWTQYLLHTTHELFTFAITMIAYWICGFIALFSFPRWSDP